MSYHYTIYTAKPYRFGKDSRLAFQTALIAVCAVSLALSGCVTTPSARNATANPQKLVEAKLDAQSSPTTPGERWEQYQQDRYQSGADIAAARADDGIEGDRMAKAQALIAAGPIDLDHCLSFALDFNDAIQAHRAAIRAVGGDELVNRARFLPSLTYRVRQETVAPSGASSTNDTYQSLLLTQTLFEFGKDNPADIALRDAQRKALFEYEDAVRIVLRDVRKRFFTLVLRDTQLRQREHSLGEFRTRYEQVVSLEAARRVLEVDVLTARLNVLSEEAQINSLQREILRQRIDLLHLMGFPVGIMELPVHGVLEVFEMDLDRCVNEALLRSSDIAQSRTALMEQTRRVHELRYEYVPAVDLRAGWTDGRSQAGLALTSTNDLYALSAYGETHDDEAYDQINAAGALLGENPEGWFVNMAMEVPIFQGLERAGNRRREFARLERARHELRDRINAVEAAVRKAYQTVLERRKQVEILEETVRISRERLRVQDELKKLGRISDNELETFRDRYFQDQDRYFAQQISQVEAQEDLRFSMRMFEPLDTNGEETP